MAALTRELRTLLHDAVLAARVEAERAARAALDVLAVGGNDAPAQFDEGQRALRNALRARARQLGQSEPGDGQPMEKGLPRLIEEVAYEQWHRLLFARFLAENGLLLAEGDVPVTLDECAQLAEEQHDPSAADGWSVAARFAARILPGIFRADDPTVQLSLSREGRAALERLLQALPVAVFTGDDALGWTYQFWQETAKKAINKSERKIGGADLGPVTQLFTEDYMVRFLLENSLGAWWAARHPDSPLLKSFSFLRYRDDGTPAAETFPGWPERVAEVTLMDPCCGSGHFLVAAFAMLRAMWMEEEGLSGRAAGDAVLRANLFGLELDARCVQIAVFALALAAWRADGYRPLPALNVACTGIPVQGSLDTWRKLAGDDGRARFALEGLYELFKDAPTLGSLINPRALTGPSTLFNADFDRVAEAMQRALAREGAEADPAAAVLGGAAEGAARAGALLAGQYTLVTTNVPYLARGRQDATLKDFLARAHADAKADIATAFVERCEAFAAPGGCYALVTPQNWLFLTSYKRLRERLLKEQTWLHVSRLGPGAFETITGEVVQASLLLLANTTPALSGPGSMMTAIDASAPKDAAAKAEGLRASPLLALAQAAQLRNPDTRVSLEALAGSVSQRTSPEHKPAANSQLYDYCDSYQGLVTGDLSRFVLKLWEVCDKGDIWELLRDSTSLNEYDTGVTDIILWQNGDGVLHDYAISTREKLHDMHESGNTAWNRQGVAVNRMRDLLSSAYYGEKFSNNVAVILPRDLGHLPAVRAFCSSSEFNAVVRRIDQTLKVTNATLLKVPFDLQRWEEEAAQKYPNGLPEPYSNDPTQWLFKGTVTDTTAPLQVAVARLLGYRWPEQAADGLEGCVAGDGIVPLPPLGGQPSGADRLRALLAAAFGAGWSAEQEDALLAAVEYGGRPLDIWLRDGFFKQHCALFHQRPFIWHVWDGRADGFAALLNYHTLDYAKLQTLIYSYLARWIETQQVDAARGLAGADGRLEAATVLKGKLEAILEGERPHDIYVRWKQPREQAIGWNPDLNDGVRLNIRPWWLAKALRTQPNIKWGVDRGKNPDGSVRDNDVHLTLAEKRAARQQATTA